MCSHGLSFQQVKLGILAEVKIAQKRAKHPHGNDRIKYMGVVKLHTKVLPGNRIELSSPELTEGQEVEVVVRPQEPAPVRGDPIDILELVKLSPEQRRPYIEAAAEKALDYYNQDDPERDAWLGEDIIEY